LHLLLLVFLTNCDRLSLIQKLLHYHIGVILIFFCSNFFIKITWIVSRMMYLLSPIISLYLLRFIKVIISFSNLYLLSILQLILIICLRILIYFVIYGMRSHRTRMHTRKLLIKICIIISSLSKDLLLTNSMRKNVASYNTICKFRIVVKNNISISISLWRLLNSIISLNFIKINLLSSNSKLLAIIAHSWW